MKNTHQELLEKISKRFIKDDSVLAIILVGSFAKGYYDEESDIDLKIVVTQERYKYQKKKKRTFVHDENYDLIFTTIDHLKELQDSNNDVDHWEYQKCQIIFDKTTRIAELINRITKYDEISRVYRLQRYYLDYWKNTLSSISCYKHQNLLGSKIYAAIAMKALISLIFNINHKWAPKLQWATKEIPFLQNKPEDFESKIEKILSDSNPTGQSELWKELESHLQKEKFSWVNCPEELL